MNTGNVDRFDMVKYRSAIALSLVVAIFIGDIWIGVTLPIAMLFAPLLFIAVPIRPRNLVPGLWMLAGMVAVVGTRWLLGSGPNGKSDLVSYLPFVYAGFTILAFRNVKIEDESLGRSIIVGGALTGAFMLVFAIVAPQGATLVPGQNFWATEQQYAASRQMGTPRAPAHVFPNEQVESRSAEAPEVFGQAATANEYAFYDVKNRFKTPLGLSNYLAVFFVFAFVVSAFTDRKWWATLFALLTIMTLSRFGIGFLILSAGCVVLNRIRMPALNIAICAIAVSVAATATLWFARNMPSLPTSLTARVELWQTGLEAVALSPLLGSFRSQVIETLNLSLTWNPHNLILLIGAYFGVIGLTLYAGYIVIILTAFHRLAKSSALWAGVFVGAVVLLCWAGFEPVAMTPAFEILMAALYAVAVTRQPDHA